MKTNNNTVKDLLHQIRALVHNDRVYDTNQFDTLFSQLQQISPAVAQQVAVCYSIEPGWVFAGADFNSLEAMIDALTTKDPKKMGVYTDGYDSHSYNALTYWPEKMPDISSELAQARSATEMAAVVNKIKVAYPDLRQDSKVVTFALQYAGTAHTLVNNSGFSQTEASSIYNRYHKQYEVSAAFSERKKVAASASGFATVAFGLRVRTPLLKQVVWGASHMPYEAAAEARTMGNALSQSYGLLNNRAVNAFMEVVWNSPYRYDIKPVALVHDAIYIMFKDCPLVAEFVNRELIKAMQWQELPEIAHEQVKLGAALDIFYKNWSQPITIPNNAIASEIVDLCIKGKTKYLNPKSK